MYLIYFWLFYIFLNKIDRCWIKREKSEPDVTKMLGYKYKIFHTEPIQSRIKSLWIFV